jgi:hypothetical protein
MQLCCKHTFPTTEEAVFSVGPPRVYNEDLTQLELEEMAVEDDWEEMAKRKLGGAKKTSYMIWSYSETVINPLLEYD